MNDVETRLVALAITEPEYAISQAKAVGLKWDDLKDRENQEIWQALEEMWDQDLSIDPATIKSRVGKDKYIDDLAKITGPADPETYAKILVVDAIERDQKKLGKSIQSWLQNQKAGDVLSGIQDELNRLSGRYARAQSPFEGNPADELETMKGWSTSSGLPFLDSLLRFTSSSLHFLAGDPGSGKSTLVTHMLTYNALHGVPSVGITAETDPIEIKLAMLTQTQKISAYFASRIRYDPYFRTKERIEKIRQVWDENFKDLPLQIHRVSDGPSAVTSLINSITKPSFICVDHAFAVISQSEVRTDGKEHQSFMRFFADVDSAAKRNNHIVVMVNQYTKAGREGEERGPDAQYGGSGIQNIATSMIHMMRPKTEISAAVGYRKMKFIVPKVRAMLVADEYGNAVDPVQVTSDAPGYFYLNTKYRLAESQLPIAQRDDNQSTLPEM